MREELGQRVIKDQLKETLGVRGDNNYKIIIALFQS